MYILQHLLWWLSCGCCCRHGSEEGGMTAMQLHPDIQTVHLDTDSEADSASDSDSV